MRISRPSSRCPILPLEGLDRPLRSREFSSSTGDQGWAHSCAITSIFGEFVASAGKVRPGTEPAEKGWELPFGGSSLWMERVHAEGGWIDGDSWATVGVQHASNGRHLTPEISTLKSDDADADHYQRRGQQYQRPRRETV